MSSHGARLVEKLARESDEAERTSAGDGGDGGVPRWHKVVLALILAAGLLRGLFWVSMTLVFNPIDEAPHYSYVESMATRLRPPVVGRDRLSPETMGLLKGTASSYWRSVPLPPDPLDDRWGAVAESYEGVQGPAYYALMALPYRAAHPMGALAALYAVRAATVLLALAAVPLAYLLARELFPRRREAWLAAPALLVLLQGFNANLASITNDALVAPLSAAVLLTAARIRRTGFTGWNGLLTGALLGTGLATKSNMVALFPLVGVWALCVARARREPWRAFLRWCTAAAVAGLATAGPWLAWNLAKYGSLNANEEVDRITGPLQPDIPHTFAGLRRHLRDATGGFWDSQLAGRQLGRYMWVASLVGFGLVVAAVIVSVARRRRQEAAALAWLGSGVFVTVAFMLLVIFVVFGGDSSVVGRHLYPALVATVVAVAAAAFVVAGPRGGWLVLAALAALTTTFEVDTTRRHVDLVYADSLIGPLAPVVEQTWAVGLVDTPVVRVDPPCRAEAFALGLATPAPGSLEVRTAAGTVQAPRTGAQFNQPEPITTYALPAPTATPFEIALPGVALSASADDRDPHLSMEGQPGDPVARVFCPVASPAAFRFGQRFTPDHPSWISYAGQRAWPLAWAWAVRVALVALAVSFLLGRRRGRRHEGVRPPEDPPQ